MIFIPSFLKISWLVLKLKWRYTQTDFVAISYILSLLKKGKRAKKSTEALRLEP
jgi:hypothetical protein